MTQPTDSKQNLLKNHLRGKCNVFHEFIMSDFLPACIGWEVTCSFENMWLTKTFLFNHKDVEQHRNHFDLWGAEPHFLCGNGWWFGHKWFAVGWQNSQRLRASNHMSGTLSLRSVRGQWKSWIPGKGTFLKFIIVDQYHRITIDYFPIYEESRIQSAKVLVSKAQAYQDNFKDTPQPVYVSLSHVCFTNGLG